MPSSAGVGAQEKECGDRGHDDAKHDKNQDPALAVALLVRIWTGLMHGWLDAGGEATVWSLRLIPGQSSR